MAKIVKVSKVQRVAKHFIEHDGKKIEVRQNSTLDHYGKDVVAYEVTLSKGKTAGQLAYWVSVADHKPSAKSSRADAILADALSGMSAKELQAKYGKEVQ